MLETPLPLRLENAKSGCGSAAFALHRLCIQKIKHNLEKNFMKKNIGAKLGLYPTPATVVGTTDENGKANFLLVAHVGIVTHSKLLLSVFHAYHSNQFIKTNKKVSVALIDESFMAQADYVGTVSGAKKDKSGVFEYHLGELGTPVIEASPLVMECEVIDQYDIDGFENFICDVKNTYHVCGGKQARRKGKDRLREPQTRAL